MSKRVKKGKNAQKKKTTRRNTTRGKVVDSIQRQEAARNEVPQAELGAGVRARAQGTPMPLGVKVLVGIMAFTMLTMMGAVSYSSMNDFDLVKWITGEDVSADQPSPTSSASAMTAGQRQTLDATHKFDYFYFINATPEQAAANTADKDAETADSKSEKKDEEASKDGSEDDQKSNETAGENDDKKADEKDSGDSEPEKAPTREEMEKFLDGKTLVTLTEAISSRQSADTADVVKQFKADAEARREDVLAADNEKIEARQKAKTEREQAKANNPWTKFVTGIADFRDGIVSVFKSTWEGLTGSNRAEEPADDTASSDATGTDTAVSIDGEGESDYDGSAASDDDGAADTETVDETSDSDTAAEDEKADKAKGTDSGDAEDATETAE